MRASLSLALLYLAACSGGGTAPPPAPAVGPTAPASLSVTVGQQFTLRVGQSASIGGASSTITFRAVASDSRCPTGTQCIQAGNARADFDVTTAGGTSTVSVNTSTPPTEAAVGPARLRLISLAPLPAAGGTPDPSAYVATVCVCR